MEVEAEREQVQQGGEVQASGECEGGKKVAAKDLETPIDRATKALVRSQ